MKQFVKHPGFFAPAKKNHAILIKDVATGVAKLQKEFIDKKMNADDIKQLLVDQAACVKEVMQTITFLKTVCVDNGEEAASPKKRKTK